MCSVALPVLSDTQSENNLKASSPLIVISKLERSNKSILSPAADDSCL
jgi:hypothetical protein